jgi:hypothetical protein
MESTSMSQHSSSDRHIHFHMHMHASSSSSFGPQNTILPQSHQQPAQHQLVLPAASSAEPYPAFITSNLNSSRQQQFGSGADAAAVQSLLSLACPASKQHHHQQQRDLDVSAADTSSMQQQQGQPQGSSKRRGRRRVRRVLRALLLSGTATAMVLAGAGGALVLLSPRVEQLEVRCMQVRGGGVDAALMVWPLLQLAMGNLVPAGQWSRGNQQAGCAAA